MTKKERVIYRKMRKGLRISQAQLAQQTSVSRTKVAKWENGTLNLTTEEEGQLVDVLNRVLMKRGIPGVVTPQQALQDLREGAILARLRAEHGITQAQLSGKAKVAQGTISHFEKGDLQLTQKKIGQLFRSIDALVQERRTSIPSGFANLADLRSAQAYETWKKTQVEPSNLQLELQIARTAGKALFESNKVLRERVGILQKLVDCQHELLSLCQELVNELGAKDAKIGELENKITQLRELYEVGTAAVLASERYEQLHQQLSAVPASNAEDK